MRLQCYSFYEQNAYNEEKNFRCKCMTTNPRYFTLAACKNCLLFLFCDVDCKMNVCWKMVIVLWSCSILLKIKLLYTAIKSIFNSTMSSTATIKGNQSAMIDFVHSGYLNHICIFHNFNYAMPDFFLCLIPYMCKTCIANLFVSK